MKLSDRVKYVVENLPISASAWSLKAGKSRGYAQKLLERDATRPDAQALKRMAEVVGVPKEWFVDGDGDPPAFGDRSPAHSDIRAENASLVERLEGVRDRMGWTWAQWEREAGLNPHHISAILNRAKARDDFRPDWPTLHALAVAAKVPVEWLAEGKEGRDTGVSTRAKGELRVERDPAPDLEVPEDSSPLVQALTQAFDKGRHLLTDGTTVIKVLRTEIDAHEEEGTDLIEKARVWLDAAAALRREGKPVTAVTLLDRVTEGKTASLRPDEADAFQLEIAEVARKHGVQFGEARYAVEEFLRKGREADEARRKGRG